MKCKLTHKSSIRWTVRTETLWNKDTYVECICFFVTMILKLIDRKRLFTITIMYTDSTKLYTTNGLCIIVKLHCQWKF